MTARRKYKSTGPLADSGTAKTKRDPPCPSALCRCGHVRDVHRNRGRRTPCYPGYPQPFCSCEKFVLAKPGKPAAKKRKNPRGLPSALPAKKDSLLDLSPQQVQTVRASDGSQGSSLVRGSYWEEQPCRFSGNGHEGCFVAPVNRHGGPCVPCWARARQRLWEQQTEIAGLKYGGKP